MAISRRNILVHSLAPAAAWLASGSAFGWAEKPVKLLVPAPPGGTMDMVARMLGEQMAAEVKVPVIIENRPGAGGAIGLQALLQAPPDGQTLMVTASNVLTEVPHVLKSSFDPMKDFKPVVLLARGMMVLVGPVSGPPDFAGLMTSLKAQAGKGSYASYAAGTASNYAGAILNARAKLDLTHVPFAGSPPALQQVMGGQIPVMFDGLATSLPLARGNKLRIYAIAGKKRLPSLPNVPTMAELGYPEIDFSNWIGLVARSNLSPELTERIAAAGRRVAESPKTRERLEAMGMESVASNESSAELVKSMRDEYARNAVIVREYGIKLAQ